MTTTRRLHVVDMSAAPEPPYPSNTQAGAFPFELDVNRLMSSDTWDLLPPEIRPWWVLLLVVSWRQTPCGAFRNDVPLIAAKIGANEKFVRVHWDELMRGWYLCADGRLYHRVITEKVCKFLGTRRKWRSNKNKDIGPDSTIVPPGFHPSSSPSSSSSSSSETSSPPPTDPPSRAKASTAASAAARWCLPAGIDQKLWEDFEQHRREIRKPLSDRARTLNAHVLLHLNPEQQRQSVEDTIRNRWTGLFVPKPSNNGSNANGNATGTRPLNSSQRAELARQQLKAQRAAERISGVVPAEAGSGLRRDVHEPGGQHRETGRVGVTVDADFQREDAEPDS